MITGWKRKVKFHRKQKVSSWEEIELKMSGELVFHSDKTDFRSMIGQSKLSSCFWGRKALSIEVDIIINSLLDKGHHISFDWSSIIQANNLICLNVSTILKWSKYEYKLTFVTSIE